MTEAERKAEQRIVHRHILRASRKLFEKEKSAKRIAELEALTQKLLGYAGHDDECQIMTHGVWSDPIPCTCGYSDIARAALREKAKPD